MIIKFSKSFWFFLFLALAATFAFYAFAPIVLVKIDEKIRVEKKSEIIYPEIQEIRTDSYQGKELFVGDRIVKVKGRNGKIVRNLYYKDVYVNSRIYKKASQPFKVEILKETPPQTEVIYVGTKKPHPSGTWKIRNAYQEQLLGQYGPINLDIAIDNAWCDYYIDDYKVELKIKLKVQYLSNYDIALDEIIIEDNLPFEFTFPPQTFCEKLYKIGNFTFFEIKKEYILDRFPEGLFIIIGYGNQYYFQIPEKTILKIKLENLHYQDSREVSIDFEEIWNGPIPLFIHE